MIKMERKTKMEIEAAIKEFEESIVVCPECGSDCNFKFTVYPFDIHQCPKCKEIVVK